MLSPARPGPEAGPPRFAEPQPGQRPAQLGHDSRRPSPSHGQITGHSQFRWRSQAPSRQRRRSRRGCMCPGSESHVSIGPASGPSLSPTQSRGGCRAGSGDGRASAPARTQRKGPERACARARLCVSVRRSRTCAPPPDRPVLPAPRPAAGSADDRAAPPASLLQAWAESTARPASARPASARITDGSSRCAAGVEGPACTPTQTFRI